MKKMTCTDSKMEVCPVTNLPDCCLTCEQNELCADRCDTAKDHFMCQFAAEQPENEPEETGITVFESKAAAVIGAMVNLLEQKKALEKKEKEVRASLTKAMDKYGVKSFENDRLKVTHIEATTKKTLDSKKLKKDYPKIYDEYAKETNVSASVRIQLKEGD